MKDAIFENILASSESNIAFFTSSPIQEVIQSLEALLEKSAFFRKARNHKNSESENLPTLPEFTIFEGSNRRVGPLEAFI